MYLRLGQTTWHNAQDQAPRRCSCRRRIFAEPHRLQPDPNTDIGCHLGKLRKDPDEAAPLCRAKHPNHPQKTPHRNGKTSNFPVFPQTARLVPASEEGCAFEVQPFPYFMVKRTGRLKVALASMGEQLELRTIW